MTTNATSPDTDRTPRRVRHELRRRDLRVRAVQRLTPHMIRITFEGEDLQGFTSLGFDDHVKLFFPDPATGVLTLPGEERPPAGAPQPIMRDYTPRQHDADAGTLVIDFAVHDAGPATQWAEQAQPGQRLTIGGPRGSMVVPTGFDWHLLVGDDTALPAIGRRLAELPAGSRAVAVIEVDGPADQMPLPSAAQVELHWVHRNGAEPGSGDGLLRRLADTVLPTGDYYAWVGCETHAAKALRAHLVDERGAQRGWIKAAGYWRRGSSGTHEEHAD